MATQTSKNALTIKEAEAVLAREEGRKQERRRLNRKRRRDERKLELQATRDMRNYLFLIQWCVFVTSIITVITFIAAIWMLVSVQREVTVIQGEVNRIRESLRHPLQTAGGLIGKELDAKLNSLIGRDGVIDNNP